MIIIISGGNSESRNELINQLKEAAEFEIYENTNFSELRSDLEINITKPIFKIINGVFLKSCRYEIYCIAKRYKKNFYILHDVTPSEDPTLEVPNTFFKHEKMTIYSYDLCHLLDKIKADKMAIGSKKIYTAHSKKISPSGDYLVYVKRVINDVNREFAEHKNIHNLCEEKFINMISTQPIEKVYVKECYKKILKATIDQTS